MPIGIFIIGGIILLMALIVFLFKLNNDQLSTLEVIVYGGFLLFVCGAIIYIIILSFHDNAAAAKLLKELIEIL
jgi:ABC-type Fe3+-siderophore transport system permease subunit